MTAIYILSTLTECLAAYRSRGILRVYLLTDALVTVALLLWWNHFGWGYDPLWRIEVAGLTIMRGAIALKAGKPRRWPVYALAACIVHAVAMRYPNQWPGSWLHADVHAVAFCLLLFGLFILANRTCKQSLPVAALFLVTAASYYAIPFELHLRESLPLYQSCCYVWIAFAGVRRK